MVNPKVCLKFYNYILFKFVLLYMNQYVHSKKWVTTGWVSFGKFILVPTDSEASCLIKSYSKHY